MSNRPPLKEFGEFASDMKILLANPDKIGLGLFYLLGRLGVRRKQDR